MILCQNDASYDHEIYVLCGLPPRTPVYRDKISCPWVRIEFSANDSVKEGYSLKDVILLLLAYHNKHR